MARRKRSGYQPGRDGSFIGWFAKWSLVGAGLALAVAVLVVVLAHRKVARDKEKMYQDYAAESVSS